MNKKSISIITILLVLIVIINANLKPNALEIGNIISSSNDNTTSIISEYQVDDDIIDINNISIENAVDTSFSSSDYNNSSLYYVGETDDLGEDANSDNAIYYIENWQELQGDLSIKVNKQASCVTVYKGETPIRAMVCSAGESTPEGTFNIDNKWYWLMLVKGQYGRYCSQISGDYLFHSVPYNSMDIFDLDTQMYNDLGTLCSHGCIRLTVEDARWIYENCPSGTQVTIYCDENPGPMGKPSFEAIPDNQTWDPTDIDVYESE